MSNLFFPRPSSSTPTTFHTDSSQSEPSSSSGPGRAPPQSLVYAQANSRAAARNLRAQRQQKSPFVPKKNAGKERDLSTCTLEDLEAMRGRNARLLDDANLMSTLAGGDVRIRNQQSRIENRIKELEEVGELRKEMQRTTLEDGPPRDAKMDGIVESLEGLHTTPQTSPSAKARIVEAAISTSPHHISLLESLHLQRLAVTRDREAIAAREAQMELDSQRPKQTGDLLQKAMMKNREGNRLSDFMFQVDSDDDGEDDYYDDLGQPESASAHEHGLLDEEEEAQLNPYKAAYQAGYARAAAEEGGGGGGGTEG